MHIFTATWRCRNDAQVRCGIGTHLVGGGLGTALGLLASILFIPYLQVGAGKEAMVPPFVVQIAWAELWIIYAVFGAMFVLAVTVLIVLLVRMNVFEAVKMGEAG